MDRRLELHQLFLDLLGSENVYFQPPESVRMNYPCIVYDLAGIGPMFANNKPYLLNDEYSVTLIDTDPDSSFRKKIAALPMCSFDRPYQANNLYHFAFTIHY